MLLATARVVLVLLIFVGGYCLHGFSSSNGFFPALTKLVENARLDDGSHYDPRFTGLSALDQLLQTLLSYFWPVCNGEHPYLSAHCVLFGGQFVAAWTISVLEGRRKRNAWRIASFTTVAGLLTQSLGAALVLPAFLALQLLTTSADELSVISHETHYVPESDLVALPYSIGLGYIVPTIAMALPSPAILPRQTKIYAILFWQAFPLWVELIQISLARIAFASSATSTKRSRQIKLYGRAYLFAFYVAMAVHIACVAMAVSSTWIAWRSGSEVSSKLQLNHFFIPPNPLSDKQALTVAEGAFWFIQFDYLISSVAYLVWSVALRYGSTQDRHTFSMRQLLELGGSILIAGPMATALTLIWERDDNVMYAKDQKESSQAQDRKSK